MECGFPVVSAIGGSFAVSAGCPQAAAAAMDCARAGGNLIDAAIAGAAVQCVVMPEATSLGGDLFALLRHGGRIVAVNASGSAPQEATVEAFIGKGHRRIPATGPLSVQTPGLVAGLACLHEQGASKPFAELLEPAIAWADFGCPVSARLAAALADAPDEHCSDSAWQMIFAPEDERLREGEQLRQPALARSLRGIARSGAEAFYAGEIARDIANTLQRKDGLMGEADLAHVRAKIVPPLRVEFGRFQVFSQPPVSQGIVLLRALRLLRPLLGGAAVKSQSTLWQAAALSLRQAFAERLALFGDDLAACDLAESMLREEQSLPRSSELAFANPGSDTTTLSVVDAKGDAIALIQSVYGDLGSCVITQDTGILLNNRLSAFFLDESHPNGLRPGRSTMHTLHSFMVEDDQGLCWAGGTPGGDHQPQVNLQVLLRLLILEEDIEKALGAPRWTTTPGTQPSESGVSKSTLHYESGVNEDVIHSLAACGWHTAESFSSIGSSKMVGFRGRDRSTGAWADRRRQGMADAY